MKFVVGEPYVHRSKLDPPMSALGSLAAAMALIFGVRFTPESCRANQPLGRQLRAMSGHFSQFDSWLVPVATVVSNFAQTPSSHCE